MQSRIGKIPGSLKLEAIGIEKIFQIQTGFMKPKAKLYAVNNVNLQVSKGETIGIVGESGCGKSTLAEILLGLQQPTSGDVKLNGRSLKTFRHGEIASIIQPVFQDPFSSLNPRKTIHSIVSLPLKVNTNFNVNERNKLVKEILTLVGLPLQFLRRLPHQLSGGQRQRVAIARALILRPEIVILDEPTSALDVSAQSQILNLLKELQKQLDLTYILISHDLAVIEYMVDRVVVFYLGKIIEMSVTDEIFDRPKHPYTHTLLSSTMIPEPGKGIPEIAIESQPPNPIEIPRGCSFHPRCPIAQQKCEVDIPALDEVGASTVACHFAGQVG